MLLGSNGSRIKFEQRVAASRLQPVFHVGGNSGHGYHLSQTSRFAFGDSVLVPSANRDIRVMP